MLRGNEVDDDKRGQTRKGGAPIVGANVAGLAWDAVEVSLLRHSRITAVTVQT